MGAYGSPTRRVTFRQRDDHSGTCGYCTKRRGPAGRHAPADLAILDTAPEADQARALDYLRRSDWVLVPVKGPEEDSVQALPMLMGWIRQVGTARLIGFLPTMHKPRRASSRYWLGELQRLAERHATQVLAPINDMASIADKSIAGH